MDKGAGWCVKEVDRRQRTGQARIRVSWERNEGEERGKVEERGKERKEGKLGEKEAWILREGDSVEQGRGEVWILRES